MVKANASRLSVPNAKTYRKSRDLVEQVVSERGPLDPLKPALFTLDLHACAPFQLNVIIFSKLV